MKTLEEIKKGGRLIINASGFDGGNGTIYFPANKKPAFVIFSWGRGWDHVSVSFNNRCLTWEEMCIVKDSFFREDECVIQYHPPKADYINNHNFVLHLWRPQAQTIPMPPKIMV